MRNVVNILLLFDLVEYVLKIIRCDNKFYLIIFFNYNM